MGSSSAPNSYTMYIFRLLPHAGSRSARGAAAQVRIASFDIDVRRLSTPLASCGGVALGYAHPAGSVGLSAKISLIRANASYNLHDAKTQEPHSRWLKGSTDRPTDQPTEIYNQIRRKIVRIYDQLYRPPTNKS